MEGKAVLFKKFAFIDVFDIEINENDPDKLIDIIRSLEPTFGGINFEDIKAPECFYIEKKLKETMNIPVFHDDQHGTAVIATAGFMNALELTGKNPSAMKMIVSGAGAAALSCIKMFIDIGMKKENIYMFDSKGLVHTKRDDINEYKKLYANKCEDMSLKDAINGADIFLGLSVKDILEPEYLRSMNKNPIVFALANPEPEIDYEIAKNIRSDIIMSTGRSDYPNQINNVLGFPFIFRGALDCGAKNITENMKMAASKALASIARMNATDDIKRIYKQELTFGADYIIPKPFDKRVFVEESYAVLKAAVEEKINTEHTDPNEYRKKLEEMI